MRFLAFILLASIFVAPANAGPNDNGIYGHWARGDGVARVHVYQCGSDFCARNTWINNARFNEKVGDVLIMSLSPQTEGLYVGTAYDPQRRMRYSFRLNISQNTMSTRGCILGGALCKSTTWQRI